MGKSWMKLPEGNGYRKKYSGCGCRELSESCCSFCFSVEGTLVGYRGTGDDDHFVCEECLEQLNSLMNGEDYPDRP